MQYGPLLGTLRMWQATVRKDAGGGGVKGGGGGGGKKIDTVVYECILHTI